MKFNALLLFLISSSVCEAIDELRKLCIPYEQTLLAFTGDLEKIFANAGLERTSGMLSHTLILPMKTKDQAKKEVTNDVAVKRIEIDVDSNNDDEPFSEINNPEIYNSNVQMESVYRTVSFLTKAAQKPEFLRYYGCYINEVIKMDRHTQIETTSYRFYLLEEPMVSMLIDPKPEQAKVAGVNKDLLKAFHAKTPDAHLEVFLSVAKQIRFLHEDFKMTINDLKPTDIMFVDAQSTKTKIVDFSSLGGISKAVFQKSHGYVDYETDKVGWSSILNDVFCVGMTFSEIEIGKLVNFEAWEKDISVKYVLKKDDMKRFFSMRDQVVDKLKSAKPWIKKFDNQSFHSLIRGMTKMERAKRIQNFDCVIAWIEYLIPAHLGQKELTEEKKKKAAGLCGEIFGVKII